MGLAAASLAFAVTEIGTEEVPRGSNDGPRVGQYIRRAGYKPPIYWCLAFAFFCVDEAANNLGLENPLPRTGSCDLLLEWARRGGHLREVPETGDLFLVMASEDDAIHVGFVKTNNGDGTITTVEGNSNNDGSRNGYEVVERKRKIKGLKFVRFDDGAGTWKLAIGGNRVDLLMISGSNYAPVRAVTTYLGLKGELLAYDASVPGVTYDGKVIPATPEMRDGKAFIPVRALARFFGAALKIDDKNKLISFTH